MPLLIIFFSIELIIFAILQISFFKKNNNLNYIIMFKKLLLLLVSIFLIIGTTIYFLKKKKKTEIPTLNLVSIHKIKTLDPILSDDRHSALHICTVYEGLFKYNPFKEGFKIEPRLAAEMPIHEGNSYTIKIKKGIKFQDNKCFSQGKGRELNANDVRYSILRNADPHLHGKNFWLIDGKIKGLNQWKERQNKKKKSDYNEKIEGLEVIDDYTIKITLTKPFPQFYQALATPYYVIVPKEAQKYYGEEFGNNPVGTGPYQMDGFNPQLNKVIYHKNPTFRDVRFPNEISEDLKSKFKNCLGKKLPLVEKVVFHIITEPSTRMLKFKNGDLDAIDITNDNVTSTIISNRKLIPELDKKGIYLFKNNETSTSYIGFNLDNKLFKNNIKLRRAISLAFDSKKFNELFFNATAIVAQSIIPPGTAGYEKKYINPYCAYDIERAKQLLEEAGYPEGKGLPTITLDTRSDSEYRQQAVFFKQCMKQIGINIEVRTNLFPELLNKMYKSDCMLFDINWKLDFPDAENILQLSYGPNKPPNGQNNIRFQNEKFDEMYTKISSMDDSEQRTIIYEEMNRLLGDMVPMIFLNHKNHLVLCQSWVSYIWTSFNYDLVQYMNIDSDIKVKFEESK